MYRISIFPRNSNNWVAFRIFFKPQVCYGNGYVNSFVNRMKLLLMSSTLYTQCCFKLQCTFEKNLCFYMGSVIVVLIGRPFFNVSRVRLWQVSLRDFFLEDRVDHYGLYISKNRWKLTNGKYILYGVTRNRAFFLWGNNSVYFWEKWYFSFTILGSLQRKPDFGCRRSDNFSSSTTHTFIRSSIHG